MAKPLNQFALQCEEVAIANGKITPLTSPSVLLHDISRGWRQLCQATTYKSEHNPKWNEKEEAASEIIVATLTYLQSIGCKDISRLLHNTLEQHRRQRL